VLCFCFVFHRLVHPVLPVSLDCLFWFPLPYSLRLIYYIPPFMKQMNYSLILCTVNKIIYYLFQLCAWVSINMSLVVLFFRVLKKQSFNISHVRDCNKLCFMITYPVCRVNISFQCKCLNGIVIIDFSIIRINSRNISRFSYADFKILAHY